MGPFGWAMFAGQLLGFEDPFEQMARELPDKLPSPTTVAAVMLSGILVPADQLGLLEWMKKP